jgi:hypothetical protein
MIIPAPPAGSFLHTALARLGTLTYRLVWRWHERSQYWTLDVAQSGTMLCRFQPLTKDDDVLKIVRWHDLCPPGRLQVTGPARIPGLNAFREEARLEYVE